MNRREFVALAASAPFAAGGAPSWAATSAAGVEGWPSAERHRIWPGDAPGGGSFRAPAGDENPSFLRGIRDPELHIYRAAHPDGRALLVFPGGGYGFVSVSNEGVDIARWFNPRGVTVLVLAYRLPGEGWARPQDVPLQDAQRAMRWCRQHAQELSIDPRRIGVLGFSAGGHLAATLAVQHHEAVYAPIDALDAQSARPDFAGLIYPVITMEAGLSHGGSRANLLGAHPDPALVELRSAERHVDERTPPCFLAHGLDDTVVEFENPLRMFQALRAARRPVEAHFFTRAQHAFSIGNPGTPSEHWPAMFLAWSGAIDAQSAQA